MPPFFLRPSRVTPYQLGEVTDGNVWQALKMILCILGTDMRCLDSRFSICNQGSLVSNSLRLQIPSGAALKCMERVHAIGNLRGSLFFFETGFAQNVPCAPSLLKAACKNSITERFRRYVL